MGFKPAPRRPRQQSAPAALFGNRFVLPRDRALNSGDVRDLVTHQPLEQVELFRPLRPGEPALIEAVLAKRPELSIRVAVDLGDELAPVLALEHLRKLHVDVPLADPAVVTSATALELLRVVAARPTATAVLAPLSALRRLSLAGGFHSHDGLVALPRLEALSTPAPRTDLAFTGACPRLVSLALDGGGSPNLDALAEATGLRHLRLNGLTRVATDELSAVASVEHVQLHYLPRVEHLGPLGTAASLRHLELATLNGLRDLSVLGQSQLRSFAAFGSFKHMRVLDLGPLAELASLQRVCVAPRFRKSSAGNIHLQQLHARFPKLSIQQYRRQVSDETGVWTW